MLCHSLRRLRWLRPFLLLLPGGALFADRDGLSTAVSAFGRFLRSMFLVCILFNSAILVQWIIDCRLY